MSNQKVKEGYNQIAKSYSSTRDEFKNNIYLEKFEKLLKPNSRILDLGCGAGVPVDKYLVEKGFDLTGLDISEEQILLAEKKFFSSS